MMQMKLYLWSLTSSSGGYINGRNSANLELLVDKTSSIYLYVKLKAHTSLSPIRCGLAPCFVNYKKGCPRLAGTCDKVYQLLAHGRWFSPGTPASSTTKTGCHDIAEILLKVALKRQKSNQNQIIKGLKEKKNPQISVLLQECVCFLNCPQMPILDDTWTLSHINMLE